MKRVICFTATMLVLVSIASAQTTMEEYRYVTQSLKSDLLGGRDLKEGYTLPKITTDVKIGERNTRWYYFKKQSTNKAFVVLCEDNKSSFFLCIPVAGSGSDLWSKYYKDLENIDREWHMLLSWAFSQIISKKL